MLYMFHIGRGIWETVNNWNRKFLSRPASEFRENLRGSQISDRFFTFARFFSHFFRGAAAAGSMGVLPCGRVFSAWVHGLLFGNKLLPCAG